MSQDPPNSTFIRAQTTNDTTLDYMHANSVYIERDNKPSHSILDETYVQENDVNSATNEQTNAKADINRKRKRREERQLRLASEQMTRLREKFDFPPSEQLIGSFSAALFRTILLQGRMYITTEHICFYTRLFGKVTKEAFPFTAMSRVKKRRGGLVANAIKIYISDDQVTPIIIGSLNHREKVFSLIQERLQILNPIAAEPRQTDDDGSGGSVDSAPCESEFPSLEDRDYSEQHRSTHQQPIGSTLISVPNSNGNGVTLTMDQSHGQNSEHMGSSGFSSQNDSDADSSSNRPSGEWERSLIWCTPDDVIGRVAANSYEKRSERARGILNVPVKDAFNLLYAENWLNKYHDAVNNREVVMKEWQRGDDSYMCRDVSFRRPIGLRIGPKETRVNEKQRYSFTDRGGVIIEVQGENLDVPYGNYFIVESFFELNPHGDGTQTLFVLSVAVHFSKSCILQGKIESGTLTETKTTYEKLLQLATGRVDAHVAEQAANHAITGEIRDHKRMHQAPPSDRIHSNLENNTDVIAPRNAAPTGKHILNLRGEVKNVSTVNASHVATIQKLSGPDRGIQSLNPVETNQPNMNSIIEAQDSSETQWLRISALGLLIMNCALLFVIVVLLNRLLNMVRTVENVLETFNEATQGSKQC